MLSRAFLLSVAPIILSCSLAFATPARDALRKRSVEELLAARASIEVELASRGIAKPSPAKTRSIPVARPAPPNIPSGFERPPSLSPEAIALQNAPKIAVAEQEFFIRRDKIDSFFYVYGSPTPDGRGAAISYSNDLRGRGEALSVQGYASAVLMQQQFASPYGPNSDTPFLYGYAVTPYLFANGTLRNPVRPTERTALQGGVDLQLAVVRGFFDSQNIEISPYLQTDFRGVGRIAGATFLYEPIAEHLKLGTRWDVGTPKFVGAYWRFVPEANIFHVSEAGYSNFESKRTYALFGVNLQSRAVLFENMPEVGDALCGRIYVTNTFQAFVDANSGRDLRNYQGEVGYILSDGFNRSATACAADGGGKVRPKTSLSFVYSNGTDKTTFEKRRSYQVQLEFKY